MKQTEQDPWMILPLKFPVGTRLQGKVRNLTSFGAFVEIEPGIDGLIHISDMSWTKRVQHPSEVVKKGDAVNVVILNIDAENKRISLGLKQAEEDPWLHIGETIEAVVLKVDEGEEKISLGMKQTEQDPWMVLPLKYPVGTRIQGKVRNLTSFGAFVEIEPGIDGLIHISDMSWTKRVQHPSEVVKKGDTVSVVILNIDAENKRISLGLKQAEEDPWLRIGETYPIGMELRGRAVRMMDKGVVVDLGNDIEGFVPMSQLGVPNLENPGDAVKEGQVVDLKVLEVDPIHHRIVLAVVGYPDEPIIPPVRPEVTEEAASQ
jgi:small subunit ribosomal protein S1